MSKVLRQMAAESASLTDRLRALNLAEKEGPVWNVANSGGGKRPWFVRKHTPGAYTEYHRNSRGDVVRFTLAGALSRAEAMNAGEPPDATGAPVEPVEDLRAYLQRFAS